VELHGGGLYIHVTGYNPNVKKQHTYTLPAGVLPASLDIRNYFSHKTYTVLLLLIVFSLLLYYSICLPTK